MVVQDLVNYSYEQGKRLLQKRALNILKNQGQFLTPPAIARFMADQLGEIQDKAKLLEPALGSAVLVCAVVEQLIATGRHIELWIDSYETDPDLCAIAGQVLDECSKKAKQNGITIHWKIYQEDFVLACLPEQQPALFEKTEERQRDFDFVISNPPYFKLNSEDKRVEAVSGKLNGHTNIYTLFMALSAKMLLPRGRACFIVPRSFCSGSYFSNFRRDLIKDVKPLSVHLFQSRENLFKNDEVLQENIIFSFEKASESKEQRYWAGYVNISTSRDDANPEESFITRQVTFRHFLGKHDGHLFFRLPTGILDEQILDTIDRWDGSLEQYGLQVSTGRVVPFRAKHLLRGGFVRNNGTAPLFWMQNIRPYKVQYPLDGFNKPQAISTKDEALLVPNANYVLLRRFSAKEDKRRLVCAPFIARNFPFEKIGLENHLNFIYRKRGALQEIEVLGLSAILNSPIVDRYFRIVNGNTQVNAAELRELPLPPIEVIRQIGKKIAELQSPIPDQVDSIVFAILQRTQFLAEEFPMIKETRITMGKIEQAQELLEALGLPPAQQNEIAALTLLALAQLPEKTPWREASPRTMRVHDILANIKQEYGREYAENTRETVRRQVLHQFEQAGIVIRNPDDPTRAVNSGKTNYVLTDLALNVVHAYGTSKWEAKKKAFIKQSGTLLEAYQKAREHNKDSGQTENSVGIIYNSHILPDRQVTNLSRA